MVLELVATAWVEHSHCLPFIALSLICLHLTLLLLPLTLPDPRRIQQLLIGHARVCSITRSICILLGGVGCCLFGGGALLSFAMLSSDLHYTAVLMIAIQLIPFGLHTLDSCSPLLELRISKIINTIKLIHHCVIGVSLQISPTVGDILKLKLEALEIHILCSCYRYFELMPVSNKCLLHSIGINEFELEHWWHIFNV